MTKYLVNVGRVDGKSGDQLTVEAPSASQAKSEADKQLSKSNPDWVVFSVFEEVSP